MSKEITMKEYWDQIKSIAEEIVEETKEQNENREWAYDRLWEMIDGHEWIIYYWSMPYVLAHTDNDDAYFEMTGERSVPGDYTGAVLQTLAFYAMHQDVSMRLEYELMEAGIE